MFRHPLAQAAALLVLLVLVGGFLAWFITGPGGGLVGSPATDDPDSEQAAPTSGTLLPDDAPLPTGWEQLVAELDRSRAPRRVAICEALAHLKVAESAPTVAALVIRDSAASVRLAAVRALLAIHPDDLADSLVTFLDHPDNEVRIATLRGLRDLADAATLRPLLNRVRDRHYQPKWLVIDALAAMRLEACIPDLARVATDHTQNKQDRIRALGHLGSFARSSEARAAIERCANDADTDIARIAAALQQ